MNQIQGFLASSPAHAGPLLCRRQGSQGKNHWKTSYPSSWFLSWFDKLEWAFSQNLSPLLPRAVERGAGWSGLHFWRLRKCSGRDWGLSYDFRSAPPDPPHASSCSLTTPLLTPPPTPSPHPLPCPQSIPLLSFTPVLDPNYHVCLLVPSKASLSPAVRPSTCKFLPPPLLG